MQDKQLHRFLVIFISRLSNFFHQIKTGTFTATFALRFFIFRTAFTFYFIGFNLNGFR